MSRVALQEIPSVASGGITVALWEMQDCGFLELYPYKGLEVRISESLQSQSSLNLSPDFEGNSKLNCRSVCFTKFLGNNGNTLYQLAGTSFPFSS